MSLVIEKIKWSNVDVILTQSPGAWCKLPYPGHKKGCPNYCKEARCPPYAPILSCTERYAMVAIKFHVGEHARRMKAKHPKWSDKQCYSCLYWQNTARKALKEWANECATHYCFPRIIYTPEAQGAIITKMMLAHGIRLEWPPKEYTWLVALIEYPTAK